MPYMHGVYVEQVLSRATKSVHEQWEALFMHYYVHALYSIALSCLWACTSNKTLYILDLDVCTY